MLNTINKAILTIIWISIHILNTSGQDSLQTTDSTSFHEYKNFVNHEVVNPYGPSVSRMQSTSAVSVITPSDFRSLNSPAIGSALAGKLTGLSVSQSGGAPGANNGSTLRVRGTQTFLSGAAGIIVLVDGFETDWTTLLPDEIESVSVLKDAAALALYGISGANGAIYIKTRQGKAREKALLTFNSRVSFQQPTVMPKFVSNGDYAELFNIAMLSDGKDISNGYFKTQEIVDYFKNGTYPELYPDVDWYEEMLKPYAITQDYSLSVNGGNQYARYNVLLGYTNTPGLFDGVDGKNNSNWLFNKYVARINLDAQINDWLRSEIKTRAMMSATKQPNISNAGTESPIWNSMAGFLPYSVKTPSGNWGGTQNYPLNPVGQVVQQGYKLINERTIDANLKLIADIPFAKGLSAYGQVVFSNNYYSTYSKTRGMAYEELYTDLTDTLNPGRIDTTIIKGDTDKNFSFNQSPGNQWNRVSFITGMEYSAKTSGGKIYASANYLQDLYTTTFTAENVPWAKINFMGRLNYTHNEKYIAEFGYSWSGTDNYAPGNKFGFFPTFSAAWVLSNESFLSANNAINFLKLRVSSGLLGNNQLGNLPRFMFLEPYGSPSGSYYIGNELGTTMTTRERSRLANPDATWEKAHKTNIGLDGELFDKISLSADYFFEKRSDIFVNPDNNMSVVIGGRFTYLNQGSAKNSGAELELMYQDRVGSFGFYLMAKTSYVKTEIIDMKEPPRAEDYLYRKGNPIGQPFILQAIGYFADSADIANSPIQTYGTVKPGDVKYKDQNDDGFIDDNDVKAFGNPGTPSFIYSFDAGLEFLGFDLSVFVQGVSGRTISLLRNNEIVPFLNDNRKPTEWVMENYWTPARGDDAKFPRLTTESNPNNYKTSTLWQRDGSYFRIKNVELGYTLPESLSRQMKIQNLRIYVNAVNPLTKFKISEIDVDPEINNPFMYPMMKSYNLGFTLNF